MIAASTSSGQTGGGKFADCQEPLVAHPLDQLPAPSFCDHAESQALGRTDTLTEKAQT